MCYDLCFYSQLLFFVPAAQAGLRLIIYLRMNLNIPSCLHLLGAGIIGMNIKPSLCGARDEPKASSMLTTKPHPQSYSSICYKGNYHENNIHTNNSTLEMA